MAEMQNGGGNREGCLLNVFRGHCVQELESHSKEFEFYLRRETKDGFKKGKAVVKAAKGDKVVSLHIVPRT